MAKFSLQGGGEMKIDCSITVGGEAADEYLSNPLFNLYSLLNNDNMDNDNLRLG